MYLSGTHRSALERLRLTARRSLGAGNFFWHAYDVAPDRDRPLVFHREEGALHGSSLEALSDRIGRYADWYRARGVRPGSRVGSQTADGLRGLLHHIAITSLGAATVHANPNMPPDVAADYFGRADVSLLAADEEHLRRCTSAAHDQGIELAADTADLGMLEREARAAGAPTGERYRHDDDDLVMICHSSGTTGRPKPTTFTHRSFFAGKRARLWSFPSLRSDRLLTALPQSHSAGISYASLALMLGIPTLVVDDPSGGELAQAIDDFRPTVVVAFPGTLAALPVDELPVSAFESVATWMGMGDASHERHIRPLLRHGASYVDGLGSSEMGMVLFRHVHSGPGSDYARKIGRPVCAARDVAVLDPDGNALPAGEPGLLGVRTASVTPGYWDDPGLTERSTLNGYFLTGDVVRRDRAGDWYHLDRTPDTIATATGTVYSLPLEEILLLESEAVDAAVVGARDPAEEALSMPIGIVLLADDGIDAAELLDRCNARLTQRGLDALEALVVVGDRAGLPVGTTGKVLKRVLRERHRTLLSDDDAPPNVARATEMVGGR
jgi:acyl-coenzyme A synthetase/AMP-(fatty) acid ligase